ncbi:MAG: imidazole glycerol phosphate synthase subunit HisH [Candidatus Omnitrophica bacterium]|nr:imidazole glycerol phosphate synthase subunit HisH [Candidatus Omnitrophota bacterium]
MIAVIDYGMGNLRSVQKALEIVGAKTKVTSRPADIKKCGKIVLPGVGAFGDAMKQLRRLGLVGPIKDAIAKGKPFLGLCLGLQLLFGTSSEAPGVRGLSILKGTVKKFKFRDDALKVPHMGWNEIRKNSRFEIRNSKLLDGIPDGSYMYFVHSYYVAPEDESIILTTTGYGNEFVSGISKDNIFGLQFHPEKSQKTGLRILENFVKM